MSLHTIILNQIYNLKGAVFGGYIRDTIAGVTPSDVDVVIPEVNWDAFINLMTMLGYRNIVNITGSDVYIFVKDGELRIETIKKNTSELGLIRPTASPDFDVNLLAYDGRMMYNWGPIGPDLNVLDIIRRIRAKQAIQFSETGPDRIEKMLSKGYNIIKVINE